jgi:hypothetical protein
MPVILATQEAEIRRITVESQPRQTVCENLSQKTLSHTQKRSGLVEWLKMKALSSSPSTTKRKEKKTHLGVKLNPLETLQMHKAGHWADRDGKGIG